MQYLKLVNNKYREFLDVSLGLKFRIGQRSNFYVIDTELEEGGFLLDENVGWINIGGNSAAENEITGTYLRLGVSSDGNFWVDIELTTTGFRGEENTDWKNIHKIEKINLTTTLAPTTTVITTTVAATTLVTTTLAPTTTPVVTTTLALTTTEEYGGGGTTYYVAETGNDTTGTGSIGSPWATIAHASTEVTTSGDVIYVVAGTITETVGTELAVGVSIEGAGNTSIIESTITDEYSYTISLLSTTENTNGNQHISNVRFVGTGGTLAWAAVYVQARSNVSVHDCEFEDFFHNAVTFNGKTAMYSPGAPTTYSQNNKFYNNIVDNCSNYYTSNYDSGQLQVGGQEGMVIHDNTMTQNNRANHNGYIIKYYNEQFGRDIKIYNNDLIKASPIDDSMDWNFAIEMWFPTGGIEIYDNTIEGSVDCLGTTQGSYDYAVSVHDNIIGYSSLQTNNTSGNNAAVFFDEGQELTYIYRNQMNNTGTPFQFYPDGGNYVSDIYIYDNIISGIGIAAGGGWNVLCAWSVSPGGEGNPVIDNWNFINNTVYANPSYAQNGLCLPDIGTASNVTVRNNILQGFFYNPINYELVAGETLDTVSIENNIFYNNGTDSVDQQGNAGTNMTIQNNIVDNPDFVTPGSDFNLQLTSPAVGAGLVINYISTDYNRFPFDSPPSIGAYEYGSEASTTTTGVTTTGILTTTTLAATTTPIATTTAAGTTTTTTVITTTPAVTTTTTAGSTLLTNLLAYWELNETSGGVAEDALGNSDLTFDGGTQTSSGAVLDGVDDFIGSIDTTFEIQTFSVSAWVTTTQTGETSGIVDNYYWSGDGWSLEIGGEWDNNGTAVLHLNDGTNELNMYKYPSGTSIRDGSEHNIIATFDGSNAYLYVDNVLEATAAWAHTITYDAANRLTIGSRSAGGQLYFAGTVRRVGIWTKVLNSDERAELQTDTYPF